MLMASIAGLESRKISSPNFMETPSRKIARIARKNSSELEMPPPMEREGTTSREINVINAEDLLVNLSPLFALLFIATFEFVSNLPLILSFSRKIVDNIINFGEALPELEFSKATTHAQEGDLALVLGTSMKVSPACNLPDKIWKKSNGKMVIVNLQKTPYDRYAKLRIFGETDVVLRMLMDELGYTIPEYQS